MHMNGPVPRQHREFGFDISSDGPAALIHKDILSYSCSLSHLSCLPAPAHMVVTQGAAAPEVTSTHHLSPQAQFLQTPTLAAWGPAPLGILLGLFLQGASFIQQGPLS